MTRERNDTESNGPGGKPDVNEDWPTGIDEDVETAQPEDRDAPISVEPRRDEEAPRAPDPSRASNAERYSYHNSPMDRCSRGPVKP